MQKLEERALLARWKSYKTFKHSGEIQLHSTSFYRELHFTGDRNLTLKEYKKSKAETVIETNQWILNFKNKKHYLIIPQQHLTFEIITVNHTVLVLVDNGSWEKTFFTKEDLWPDYLQSNTEMTL